MVPFFIQLFIMVFTIMTIFHCCRLDIPKKKKIIIVILILLTTIIGVIVYWIWFAIKKPAVLRTANKFSNSDRQVIGMECKTTSIDAVEDADEKQNIENNNYKNLKIMEYKVLPFNANLNQKDAADVAVNQLQTLINAQLAEGYEFVSLGSIETSVAPENGCLGIGAKPGYTTSVAVAFFKKE